MGSKIYIYCPIILIRNFFHYFPKLDSQSLIGLMEFVSLDVHNWTSIQTKPHPKKKKKEERAWTITLINPISCSNNLKCFHKSGISYNLPPSVQEFYSRLSKLGRPYILRERRIESIIIIIKCKNNEQYLTKKYFH